MLSCLCTLGNAIPTSSILYLFRASLREPQIQEKSEAVYIYLFVCDLAQQQLGIHAQTPRDRPLTVTGKGRHQCGRRMK